MNEKLAVVIPARLGSKRVKAKNLRKLNGKTLIVNMIEKLQQTQYLQNIYINSDSELFGAIANQNKVKFYQRQPELATSESLIDDYIFDFISQIQPEFLAVVNSTSPFISPEALDNAWLSFQNNNFDTLLSCEKIQTHCFYKGKPVNFSIDGKHPRSQDLEPVRALNFAITIWNCQRYIENYESKNYGVYTGKLGFYDIEGIGCIDIDYEDDFQMAEFVSRYLQNENNIPVVYDDVAAQLIEKNVDFAN
ncbi:MAG: hypothetical protein DWQ05_14265 [Calditrichaeota bacterium]|nr:MAG: hypothetical protein DWQ05_14265 [Calditrichota bacterium]